MRRAFLHFVWIGLIALLSLISWGSLTNQLRSYESLAQKRDEHAQDPDAIYIAIVWPRDGSDQAGDDSSLMRGAKLAEDEINSAMTLLETKYGEKGNPSKPDKSYYRGIEVKNAIPEKGKYYCKGIPLIIQRGPQHKEQKIQCTRIELKSFRPLAADEVAIARELSAKPEFVAVIGHSTSDIAKQASVPYQFTHLLFFSVNATDPSLNTHEFSYVFRNIPSDKEVAESLAKILEPFGTTKIGMFYARSHHSLSAVNLFTEAGLKRQPNLDVVLQKSYGLNFTPPSDDWLAFFNSWWFGGNPIKRYERYQKDLRAAIEEVRKSDVQTILLLDDEGRRAGEVLQRIREQGVCQLILSGPTLDSDNFFPGGAENKEGGLLHLPSASGWASYSEMKAPEQSNYIEDRASQLRSVFTSDIVVEPIKISTEMVKRIREHLKNVPNAVDKSEPPLESLRLALYGIRADDAYNLSVIKSAFKAEGLPFTLGIYLAIIESMSPYCSYLGGSFQLPRADLKSDVNSPVGECDLENNIKEVARYLKACHSDFDREKVGDEKIGNEKVGDMVTNILALLSYKNGPKVPLDAYKLIAKQPSPEMREEKLWSLLLAPAQGEPDLGANDFIWRFLAAAIVGENPADFGVPLPPFSLKLEDLTPGTTCIASVFSPNLNSEKVKRFVTEYKGHPNFMASQGYEAVKILAQAFTIKGSIVPSEISSTLRSESFDGITGKVSFDENGNIKGKQIFLKPLPKQGDERCVGAKKGD